MLVILIPVRICVKYLDDITPLFVSIISDLLIDIPVVTKAFFFSILIGLVNCDLLRDPLGKMGRKLVALKNTMLSSKIPANHPRECISTTMI